MESSTSITLLTLLALGLLGVVSFLWLRGNRKSAQDRSHLQLEPRERLTIAGGDPGQDPLDPRGDGKIRPGDPLWDVFLKTMEGDGNVVIGNRRVDGDFDLEVYPLDRSEAKPEDSKEENEPHG